MLDEQTSQKSFDSSRDLYSEASCPRHISKNHAAALARAALARTIAEIDSANKSRRREIAKLAYVIEELQFQQPADLNQLAESLGQSTNTTRNQLKQLQKLDLVVKTAFEHHTLYCVNGNHNVLVSQVLSFLNFG